ncbi:substrate-binding periplasmic protein [Candidatus Bandiella euplotis]|uniref:Amino acid ABC transporter substrate-binding protein n=1 Tax=Candidatus Bandiella euplotis TaxID=1664265 RepID=A0ABZ0ULT9_9RICK|nr:transporter substrate-binding domain-containing protein [Candidatus Bandiella woodruffii]WPX96226.1 Putative amino acid ABC transporter substrate-binding protein [Candidatus Bandiella woodruffii]
MLKNEARPVITVGISPDYPPFAFVKGSRTMGLDIELIRTILNNMDYNTKIEEMEFSALIPALNSNKVDVILSGLSETPERAEHVKFSNPYYTSSSFSVIVSKKSTISEINELPQNAKIGVQTGSVMEQFINKFDEANKSSFEIMSDSSNAILIEKVKSGEIDGMIVEDVSAPGFTKDIDELKYFDIKNGVAGLSERKYSIGFRKDSQLVDGVNEELENLKNSGDFKKLLKGWKLKYE